MLRRKPVNHKVEIGEERHLSKALANRKTGTAYSLAKKFTFIVIAAATLLTGSITAATGNTPQAHAITVDPISDMLCPTVNNGTAYLGGISQPIIDGFKGVTGEAPWEGLFGVWSIPQVDRDNIAKGAPVTNQWTTLERYGYYGTEYTNWVGMQAHYPLERVLDEVFSDGKMPFMGTGGNPGTFGAYTNIIDGASSPLFSQSVGECVPVASHATITVANTIQSITQTVTAASLNLYIMSSNLSLTDENSMLRPLGQVFELLISGDASTNTKGLKDLLFLDFMFPLLMIGAIVIFFRYARTSSMLKAFQEIGWILLVIVTGMILLSRPLLISSAVDGVVNTVTGGLSKAMLTTNGVTPPECALPSNAPQKVERELSCYLWMQNVYSFWVEGQFGYTLEQSKQMTKDPAVKADISELGEPDEAKTFKGLNADNWAGINRSSFSAAITTEDGASKKGSANFLAMTALGYNPQDYYPDYESMFNNSKPVAGEPRADGTRGAFANFDPHLGSRKGVKELKNWAYYQMDTSSTWPVSNGYNHSEVAYNQLVINDNTYWKNPENAPTSASIGLIYSFMPSIVTFLFSVSLITLQISMTLLVVVAPFVFAVALIPAFGQRVMFTWIDLLTSVTVRRIILAFFFFLYLKLYFVILSAEAAPMMKFLLVTVLAATLLTMREQISKAVSKALSIGRQDVSEMENNAVKKVQAMKDGAQSLAGKATGEGSREKNEKSAERVRQARKRAQQKSDKENDSD